jgi:5-(carboxyamino)imidazole ribonucleotide mutase
MMFEYARGARQRGLQVIIAGAGGAAHLPGMVAALTTLPVLGVPIRSSALGGVDSLLSIVQMPAGVPTATFAIGEAGAVNAALFALRMLALEDAALAASIERDRDERARAAVASSDALRASASTAPEQS